MDHRTYSQEEIAAMLERAAALQAQQSDKSDFNTGLTFAELEEIATEAGIDSEHLRQAARELNAPGQGLLDRGSGSNATHIFANRFIGLPQINDPLCIEPKLRAVAKKTR